MVTKVLKRTAHYASMAWHASRLRNAKSTSQSLDARHQLVARMGRSHGLPQKLGQMLSVSRKDRDGEDMTSAAEFASLQEHAEALSWDNVRPILQTAWGRPPEQL